MVANLATAQEETLHLAKRLYMALDTQSHLDAMANNLQKMTRQQIALVEVPEQARSFVEQKYSEIYTLLFNTFKTQDIQQRYIASFAETYTEQELKQVVDFFESPADR